VGCYLQVYRATVGTCDGRISWRDMLRRVDANGTADDCLGLTVLSSTIFAVLLIFGGI
jgi:hypothetical protein